MQKPQNSNKKAWNPQSKHNSVHPMHHPAQEINFLPLKGNKIQSIPTFLLQVDKGTNAHTAACSWFPVLTGTKPHKPTYHLTETSNLQRINIMWWKLKQQMLIQDASFTLQMFLLELKWIGLQEDDRESKRSKQNDGNGVSSDFWTQAQWHRTSSTTWQMQSEHWLCLSGSPFCSLSNEYWSSG